MLSPEREADRGRGKKERTIRNRKKQKLGVRSHSQIFSGFSPQPKKNKETTKKS